MRLSTCSHCGGKMKISRMSDGNEHWFYIHGGRGLCECRVFMESEKFTDGASDDEIKAIRRELIEKWNRRKNDATKTDTRADGT